ncbi:MAG: 30S ribosomal protein S13 [Candidatus Latescibacteria bacterium]|nr:30S ribosomal protein S13 [Candidatus Latescibacterota bacterium]
MARIAGVDLPREKRTEVALTRIFGIGHSLAKDICEKAQIPDDSRVMSLTEEQISNLRRVIEGDCKVEGELRSEITMNIKRLMDIGSYRGLRHRRGLPVHGQRTRTNARTRKGPRRTVAGKKK